MSRYTDIVPLLRRGPVLQALSSYTWTSGNTFGDVWAQQNALIGFRGVNSLSYAPHALQEVWSYPDNALAYSNTFSEWTTGASTVTKINGTDWAVTQAAGGDLIQSHKDTGVISHTIELPVAGSAQWIYFSMRNSGGTVAVDGWINGQTGELGSTDTAGGGVLHSFTQRDGRTRLCGELPGVAGPELLLRAVTADGSQSVDSGAQYLVKQAQASPGDVWVPYVETQSVSALDNWNASVGGFGESFGLAYSQGRACYLFDCSSATQQVNRFADGTIVAGIPHTYAVVCWGQGVVQFRPQSNTTPALEVTLTDTPTRYDFAGATTGTGQWTIQNVTGQEQDCICFFEFPQLAEGPQVSDLETQGAARYQVRCLAGVGRLNEPSATNKTLPANVAPTDTTLIEDTGGASTTVFGRDDPAVPDALAELLGNLDPEGTIRSLYRTIATGAEGRSYCSGGPGNLNDHNVSSWVWSENTGVIGVALALGTATFNTGGLERINRTDTPTATGNRLAIVVKDGETGWWFGQQMVEGSEVRSLIAVNGSLRVRAADNVVADLVEVGIDTGQNRLPQSSNQGAATPSTPPDNWTYNASNGWTITTAAVGSGYLDIRFEAAAATGSADVLPQALADAAAAQGQTWFGIWDVAVVNAVGALPSIFVNVDERDAAQGFLGTSQLFIQNIVSGDRRTFTSTRTLSGATAAFASTKLGVDGTGAFDVTFRVWTDSTGSPTLQKTTAPVRRVLTTGTAVDFAQWGGGLTVVDEWDLGSPPGDFARLWEMYGTDGANNRISVLTADGANINNGYLSIFTNGTNTQTNPSTSVIGLHTTQTAVREGEQEFWIDGTSQGQIASSLSENITTVSLGNNFSKTAPSSGVQKRTVFFDDYATSSVISGTGFGPGFDNGFG